LKEGEHAPEFTSTAHTGDEVSTAGLRGRWAVVYFYPADDTPGCTKEACAFRDGYEDFTDAGAVVVGVSAQGEESHRRFAEKHRLPFQLLSDGDGAIAAAFGVRKTLGLLPARVTFVIDPEGVVRKVFSSQVRMSAHHDEALAAIRAGSAA
jgi:peroxiredoxin Q/BCP